MPVGSIALKVNKTLEEVEFEKSVNECTHAPMINNVSSHEFEPERPMTKIKGYE